MTTIPRIAPSRIKTARPIDRLLTWAFQREAAGRTGASEWWPGWGGESRDGVVACARNNLFGGRIDGGGLAKAACQRGHPDAEALWQAVQGQPLLIEYARQGGTPDWMPGAQPRPMPIRQLNGKSMVMSDEPSGPLYCLLKYTPTEDQIAFARRVYADWHDALAELAAAFRTGDLAPLRDWEPLPPAAPARPWEAAVPVCDAESA